MCYFAQFVLPPARCFFWERLESFFLGFSTERVAGSTLAPLDLQAADFCTSRLLLQICLYYGCRSRCASLRFVHLQFAGLPRSV